MSEFCAGCAIFTLNLRPVIRFVRANAGRRERLRLKTPTLHDDVEGGLVMRNRIGEAQADQPIEETSDF